MTHKVPVGLSIGWARQNEVIPKDEFVPDDHTHTNAYTR